MGLGMRCIVSQFMEGDVAISRNAISFNRLLSNRLIHYSKNILLCKRVIYLNARALILSRGACSPFHGSCLQIFHAAVALKYSDNEGIREKEHRETSKREVLFCWPATIHRRFNPSPTIPRIDSPAVASHIVPRSNRPHDHPSLPRASPERPQMHPYARSSLSNHEHPCG